MSYYNYLYDDVFKKGMVYIVTCKEKTRSTLTRRFTYLPHEEGIIKINQGGNKDGKRRLYKLNQLCSLGIHNSMIGNGLKNNTWWDTEKFESIHKYLIFLELIK